MQGLDDLYREVILDHYRTPHGSGEIAAPSVQVEGFNPLCGDELVMSLDIDEGRIRGLCIKPTGCSISVASASMLAQQLEGKTLDEAIELKETFKAVMRGADWPPGTDPGDLEALEGVKNFPVRIKCALLAWMTLEQALAQHDPKLASQVEADKDIEVRAH
ncbi:MAG TPA: SUF system NifU family Fe-S cluster assembly protein [Acidobacteriota bacterium]|nr:SUF system NifU family Fe-S cluster assembly protein [Acidobacteriota bacterium]